MNLPKQYHWLDKEPGPKILLEAMKLYGTLEGPGGQDNPVILGWAKEIGGWIADFYKADEIPWCGLFVAVCAKRAGYEVKQNALGAINWLSWGEAVTQQRLDVQLGDILIFRRTGGNHVGLYVGEDATHYHVLGGNQGNQVCIVRIERGRLLGARRCPWKVGQPPNVRRVFLDALGPVSMSEA